MKAARVIVAVGALYALFVVTVIGCSPKAEPESAPDQAERQAQIVTPPEPTALTYTGRIKDIIDERCSPCHFEGGFMYSAAPYETYAGVSSKTEAIRQRVVVQKNMPLNMPMPQSERDLIAEWIDAGAPR